jgi:hypothetical protein
MAQSALNVFRFWQRIPDHWSATFAERRYRDGLSDGVARNGRWMFGDYGPPWPSFGVRCSGGGSRQRHFARQYVCDQRVGASTCLSVPADYL